MLLDPLSLEGGQIRLEPLSMTRLPGLRAVGPAPELWALTVDHLTTAAALTRYVERALADATTGAALPLATI